MGDAKGHTITPASSPIFMGGLNADGAIIDEMGLFAIEVGSFRTFDIEDKVSFDTAARLMNGEFWDNSYLYPGTCCARPAVPPAL